MSYTAGFNFDVSNLDSNFYKKLSTGTPISDPYKTITLSGSAANLQIQEHLNSLNDLFIDDSVRVVLKFGAIEGSTNDARVNPTYYQFSNPVLIDHAVADKLVIEGVAPSDHSVIGVSYYDAANKGLLNGSGETYSGATAASQNGYFAQLIITNGNSLKIGEYLAVYDNRYQKYLNPSFYKFTDSVNGRIFSTPYPVTAEKLRASLINGVHKIVDKIDLEASGVTGATVNPETKVDYVTVHINNYNPTYTIGLQSYGITFARRAYLTPQGIIGRYEQGYGSSTVLEDPLFFSGLTSGTTGDDSAIPGYRSSTDYKYGVGGSIDGTKFLSNVLSGSSAINANQQGLTSYYVVESTAYTVGAEWERYERLYDSTALNPAQNYRDSNDFRAKGFKTIIECTSDGFVIANANKAPEIKNILILSKNGSGNGIRVDNSSSVNIRQIAVVGFTAGAGIFANNKSTVNILADKFSDPEVFREVGAFSCCNYTGFEARNHSNINSPRSIATGNRFANYYAAENSYINAYAVNSISSHKHGIVSVGKSFINADSAFSCFNASDGFFSSNGSLLTINSGRACYNYGNGVHAFSSGEVRAFDIIVSSNKKDGIVANDMSTIICGDSSKEPVDWDTKYGYSLESPYYRFENPTNVSQSRFNGIAGLAASTDSFVNASFFETHNNSRLGGEWGKLRDVNCIYNPLIGYCFGGASGSSAGMTCDAGYRYCDDAVYTESISSATDLSSLNALLNDKTPTNSPSYCIPYTDSRGVTAQVPVSKSRYLGVVGKVETIVKSVLGNSGGITMGRILACKGYLPGCLVIGQGYSADSGTGVPGGAFGGGSEVVPSGYGVCSSENDVSEIILGSTGTAIQSFAIANEILACTADTSTLLLNTVCVSQDGAFLTPPRPLALVIPNYDVEIRDSSKIALAGRIANFGYYDIRTGVRIQPFYGQDLSQTILRPATLVGYAGNRNGSELVITDQTTAETGILGDQGIAARDTLRAIRYSSEDFLSAADLYDPVAQTGYINTEPYKLDLGKIDPETGALTSAIGITASSILFENTASVPQASQGTNDSTSGNGYPTY